MIDVPEKVIFSGTSETEGMNLPFACRQGVCSTCTGQLIEGSVDQTEQSYLDDDQVAEGYVLICIAHPTSDCVIKMHQQEEVL